MNQETPSEQPRADVRLVRGQLASDELAAIAVVVSAMSVTSRLEAEERDLAEGRTGGPSAWSDPVHTHPRAHGLRSHPSPTAWQFSDR
ncbi:acyl-CoA carboxylase subunit epsilon [Brachybacterium sp. GCM10030268]|uniref:acyl-CoA carboxylase subunit epsilon n=1 Tax=Brachybacterium sp. GCM10030268 TaxID=3273382 RepID=UPI0036110CBF